MFVRLAARDLVFLAAWTALWSVFAATSRGTGMLSDLLGLLLGLGAGAGVFVLHEWGHLLGALASKSVVHPPERLRSLYLFSFDSRANSRRQFVAMSLSGFAVTGVAVWGAYALLPDALHATRVARGAVLVLASLTLLVELPILIASFFTAKLPPVEVFPAAREGSRGTA